MCAKIGVQMLLIYNTIIDQAAQKAFEENIDLQLKKKYDYDFVHVSEEIPNLEKYTHLLLSGSELSASSGSEWDEKIIKLIKAFALADNAILGICHGHQMIARALGAKCRKTAIPEFSWRRFEIIENHLFSGIENPIFLESHYDEVYDLTDDFCLIATSPECGVQAFQVKGKPIWGIQFHPEVNLISGNKMIDDHIAQNAQDKPYYRNDLKSEKELEQNIKIFENFLMS